MRHTPESSAPYAAKSRLSELRPTDASALHALYTDPKLFDAELESLFGRAWIFLGHECQIPRGGDFFLGHMGKVSVIVLRDRAGAVQVLENRCAHRGAAVCTQSKGQGVSALMCPYHGWTYNLDGSLRGLPASEDYGTDFQRDARGLRRAANVATYRGFIFASLASDAPELSKFLGPAAVALDNFMERSPEGALEPVAAPLRHLIRANWKLVFENLNDVIHPLFAHASVGAAGRALASRTDPSDGSGSSGAAQVLAQNPAQVLARLHDAFTVTTSYGHSFQSGIDKLAGTSKKSVAALLPLLSAARGEAEARRILDTETYVAILYPSVLVKAGSQNLRVIRPLSVNETEVSTYVYRLKGAPPEVLSEAFEYHYGLGSPASPVFSDDMHIYELIQADYARSYLVSMERATQQLPDENGRTSATNEHYIRCQYRAWNRYLSGEWP